MAEERDSAEVGDGGVAVGAMVAGGSAAAADEAADELEVVDRRDRDTRLSRA